MDNDLIKFDKLDQVKKTIQDNKKNWINLIKNSETIMQNIEMRDRMSAYQKYLQGKRDCQESKNDLWEVEEWNNKKIGEWLLKLKEKGIISKGHTQNADVEKYDNSYIRINDLNLTRDESSICQKIALIENDKFEEIIKDCKEHDKCNHSNLINKSNFEKKENEIKEIKDILISEYGKNIYFKSNKYSEKRFGDKLIDLENDESFPTFACLDRLFHKNNLQEFSLREYARIQTFPDDFKFVGNYSSIKKQIGNAVAPEMGKYISKNLNGKTYGDLFSGCGGFSLGLEMNNKKCLWAVERNESAIITYKINFPDSKIYKQNITEIKEIESVDIIIGGPPCQGFSLAGKRFKDDLRNKLYKEFLRIITLVQPKEFIMENVPQILDIKDEILKDFLDINYTVKYEIIEGNKIGIKQNRKRCFFTGIKNEL